MPQADLIETIRSHIYRILYKWGYKLGHLMAKLGSLSFIKGVRNAFSNTITEEMNLNLAADNFSNIFDSVATATVRDLTTQISQDLENSWDNDNDLTELQTQAMEELHIERTIDSLKTILSDPSHPITLATLSAIAQQDDESLESIHAAVAVHNEQKPPEAKELLLAAHLQTEGPGAITYSVLSDDADEVFTLDFVRTINDDEEWHLAPV